jgi:predicted dehydrogenase
MAKYGAMVIGPGWVAGEHVKGYCQDPRTEIRAIVGMLPEDKARAEHYMARHDFKADYYDDLDKALARDDIQIVSVCTINFLHYAQTLACIQAGKNVLCEKPLCFTLDELRTLVAAEAQYGVRTQVGHVCRWYPAVIGLKNFIDSGAIGDVFYVESDYWHEIKGPWKVRKDTGGSALTMGGIHAADMLRWMAGEDHEIVEVAAFSEKSRWRDFEYDPTIAFICQFDNGTVGRVSTSLECNMPYVFHLQVNGTQGCIRNNGLYSTTLFPQSKGFTSIPATYPDDWNVSHHPFPEEVGFFIDCVEGNRESHVSIRRAAKTYELIFAAERAAAEHQVVKLPLL